MEVVSGRGQVAHVALRRSVGVGISYQVQEPVGVQARCVDAIRIASAQVRRVHHHRIDHQRARPVVVIQPQSDRLAGEKYVPARNLAPLSGDRILLINHRPLLRHCTAAHRDRQVAIRSERQLRGAAELQADRPRIRAGPQHKIVFQPALAAVVNHVDAGIDVRILHLGIAAHAGMPRVARSDEVVRTRGERIQRFDSGRRGGADEGHGDRRCMAGRNSCAALGQQKAVPSGARRVTDIFLKLALVGFKTQGQTGQCGAALSQWRRTRRTPRRRERKRRAQADCDPGKLKHIVSIHRDTGKFY